MTAFLQFAAVTALGLIVAWAFSAWTSLFENFDVAFVIWVAVIFSIGWIVDRRAKRRLAARPDVNK